MNKNYSNIPQGYKPSPLGPVPEDWEVKRLGDFSTFFSGGTPKSGNALYYNGTIPFIRSGEINRDRTELFLSQEGIDNSSAKFVEIGDILYALYGANSGQCSLSKINGVINQAILCIRPEAERYYIMTFLQLNKDHYYNSYLQGGQGNLSGEIVSNYKIAIPPIEEQKRICTVLQLWDTAIEKQAALIEQLTLRKRSLMQQLLTGKKWLKGFEGEWKEVRLGEIAKLVGGGTPTTKNTDYWNGKILWISSSDLKEDDLSVSGTRFITEEAIANSATQLLPTKSILIVTRVGVGKVAIAEQPTCVSQDFTCLTKYDAETNFLAYYLQQLMKKKKNQSQGTSIKGISVDEISKIRIYLPTKKEQIAIASVLINADKGIELANKKLASLQEEKRGLMQVLLSGKKRIK